MEQKMDFYQQLRKKIDKWLQTDEGRSNKFAGYVMLAPDLFHLLVKLSLDPEVSRDSKAKLALALAYFLSPVDLIPEILLGPVGFLDDIAMSAYVINQILTLTNPEIIKKHWAGDGDILQLTREIIAKADEMIGSGLWNRIKNKMSS